MPSYFRQVRQQEKPTFNTKHYMNHMRRRRTFGFSFSPSRAIGLAGFKVRLSRRIGVPLTAYGRRRKVGHWLFRVLGLPKFF